MPTDAVSVSANVTVPVPMTPGELHVFAGDQLLPLASTISFRAGRTRANNAILQLASDGTGAIVVQNESAGTVHLIVDVSGYFR